MCCCFWWHCLAGEQPVAVGSAADTVYRKLVSLPTGLFYFFLCLNVKGCAIENAKH